MLNDKAQAVRECHSYICYGSWGVRRAKGLLTLEAPRTCWSTWGMAALWPSKGAHPPIVRQVSARSLDGFRLSAEIVVKFRRNLAEDAANGFAEEIAQAAADVLGEQISQGRIPLTASELVAAIEKRTTSSVTKATDLEVSLFDKTGAAVGTRRDSPPPRKDISGSRSAAPAPPRKDVTGSTAVSLPPSGSTAASSSPPSRKGVSGSWSAVPPRDPAVATRPSGSALAAPPRTLWPMSLSKCTPGISVTEIAAALGPALRDSTAAVLLRVLMAMDPTVTDRLGLFDGRGPVPALRTEICACLAAGLRRLLVAAGLEAGSAALLTEVASQKALAAEAPPGAHIGSYATSEAPIHDLARRAASIIGTPEDAAGIYALLSPYCEALRVQFELVGQEIARLTAK